MGVPSGHQIGAHLPGSGALASPARGHVRLLPSRVGGARRTTGRTHGGRSPRGPNQALTGPDLARSPSLRRTSPPTAAPCRSCASPTISPPTGSRLHGQPSPPAEIDSEQHRRQPSLPRAGKLPPPGRGIPLPAAPRGLCPAAFAGSGGRGEGEERLSGRIRCVASPVARGGRRGRAEAFFRSTSLCPINRACLSGSTKLRKNQRHWF
jgi:hypothetical protein